MKIPGDTLAKILTAVLLTVTKDSSIVLLIENREKSILVESISTANESLEVDVDGLRLKVTGRNTTAQVLNLIKNARRWGTFPTSESY